MPAVSDLTLRLGTPRAFASLRAMLAGAGYDEGPVASRLGGQSLIGVPRIAEGRKTLTGPVEDANAALIRLLLDGDPLPEASLARWLGAEGLGAMVELGLVEPSADDPSLIAPRVMLTPLGGLWLASDVIPVGDAIERARQDHVYSPTNELTGEFLAAMPDLAGARVVELCAGTGIAALRALQRGAASALATDVAGRCVHFARFNAVLNGFGDRMVAIESDVWGSIDGAPFDVVMAHPPYVPALSHRFDFRDAGTDGEQVTRRIFEGLPAHLAPGGRCILRAALSDRRGAPIARRVREWLGEASPEFDIVQLESGEYGPMVAYKNVARNPGEFVDLERWLRHFAALEIERFAVCVMDLRREAFGRPPVTERRSVSPRPGPMVADWLHGWGRFMLAAGETPEARLAGVTPRAAPGVRVAVHLALGEDDQWRTIGSTVEAKWPTLMVVRTPALVPTLLELCDGTRDLEGLLEGLRAAGLVSGEVGTPQVAQLVEVLAAAGALTTSACPVPPMPSSPG